VYLPGDRVKVSSKLGGAMPGRYNPMLTVVANDCPGHQGRKDASPSLIDEMVREGARRYMGLEIVTACRKIPSNRETTENGVTIEPISTKWEKATGWPLSYPTFRDAAPAPLPREPGLLLSVMSWRAFGRT
jgi:hypothetical protein